jgi:hypothetical protein
MGERELDRTTQNGASFWIAIAVAGIMVLGGVGLAGAVMVMSPDRHGASPMPATAMAGATLDLDLVSNQIAGHYHFASAHRSMFETVPCFCGCEAMLGHRSLLDCFVRADGAGWEPHAAGCAVCIEESQMIRRMLGRGVAPESIPNAVIDRFE